MATQATVKRQDLEPSRTEQMRDRPVFTPHVDIIEQPEELVLVADMPGVEAKDVDVRYEQGELTLHGKVDPRQDEQGTSFLLREYNVGDYWRTFRLGEGIDPDGIRAELKNGVMELHLPKAKTARPRKIAVQES